MRNKALALLSGGLDSRLALRLMLERGVEVEVLNFITIFCRCTSRASCRHEARKAAEELGLPLKVINFSRELLGAVKAPKYGYGSGVNPCLDCRISMFKRAKERMEETGASFIVTGEVLGERPMSQRKAAMALIEREAGLDGLILRPLSAKLLGPSAPERAGIVERSNLLGIRGRSRKVQIELAEELGMKDYPCPAGGCLLTDPEFSRRMRDLLSLANGDLTLSDAQMLKFGRHFRVSSTARAIVGRNEGDNQRLRAGLRSGDWVLELEEIEGPVTVLRRADSGRINEQLALAAAITARYSKLKQEARVAVQAERHRNGEKRWFAVAPVAHNRVEEIRV